MNIQSKNIKSLFVAGFFTVSSLVGVAAFMQSPDAYAAGQTCTWTGAGADNNFSTAANWSNCGSAAPTVGDIIRFDRQEALEADENLVNDLEVALGGVVVKKYSEGVRSSAVYAIDQLTFVDGAQISEELEAPHSYRGVDVFVGAINGQGSLTNNGGLVPTNYNGSTESRTRYNVTGILTTREALFIDSSSTAAGLVVASGFGTVGTSGYLSDFTYASLTIQKGTYVYFESNFSKPITFGGGSGDNPIIAFGAEYRDGGPIPTTRSWTSPVTLLSDASVLVNEKATVNFTGTLNGVGFKLTKEESSVGAFNSNPTSNNSSSETGTLENKAKETKLEGNVVDGATVVDKEMAILLGTRGYLSVIKGGVLKGTGTITNSLWVQFGATVAPGLSPGCLTVGTFTLLGTYQVELGGTTACSGHDQIKVTGKGSFDTVNIGEDATLELYGYGNFTQQKNDTFVIIDNQTSKAVEGTFKGLAEGAEVKVGEAVFTIGYKGGDGNDVVLTAQNSAKLPGVPNTGIAQVVMANPVVVLAASVLAVGAVLVATRKKAGAKA